MVDQLRTFTVEVIRVTREVGAQGKLGARPASRACGHLKALTDSINEMRSRPSVESTQANVEQDWLNRTSPAFRGCRKSRLDELGRSSTCRRSERLQVHSA